MIRKTDEKRKLSMQRKMKKETENKDDLYIKIWEVEQRHVTTRWTVSTFFFSISFAIFGLAIQAEKSPLPLYVTTSVAIAIYWFAYALYLRFNDYTDYLRSRLEEMEENGLTTLDLQSKAAPYLEQKKKYHAVKLIKFFGILYTIAGIVISVCFNS
ncbi:MAG TPA: hypothetical protein DIW27_05560 [Cytophagales bacterium]|nr:hypothetical protein [Cytophagales bacterium]HRJ57192.1 hypothetical protein [Anaerolineales bacterium]